MTELERALMDLGDRLDAPAGDDLSGRVISAIAAPVKRAAPWRRWIALLVAAAVGLGAAAAAPTVADWLGVGGVEVRQEPPPRRAGAGAPLRLGRPVSLEAAARLIEFELVLPSRLGTPDEVWFDDRRGTPVVALVYRAGAGLPPTRHAPVGALLTQARVGIADELLATKFAAPGMRIEPVDLGSGRALWIEGARYVAFDAGSGQVIAEQLRVSDNVLLWERGGVTLRLETALGRDDAIVIARSAR